MNLTHLSAEAATHGLFIMAECPDPESNGTIVLIGADATFWGIFTASPEYKNNVPNPVDTWSKRIITRLADGQPTVYPSDGPPYAPFIQWALGSDQFFQSPVGMMVHQKAGLMISIRGAIKLSQPYLAPTPSAASPCVTCVKKPCLTACPVGALGQDTAYDVPACKAYLNSAEGTDCMTRGCAVRRTCPISQRFDRPAAQSAYHMSVFI